MEKAQPYRWPTYGLIKSTVIVCALLTSLIIGVFGWSGFGLTPAFTESTRANNLTVLAAAPFKTRRIGVEITAFTRLNDPPEYSKMTFLKTQFLQSNPSRGWMRFETVNEETTISGSGGTIGSAPPTTTPRCANAGCTNMDVWFPNKNITRTPSANDPNDTVTLDITPPSENELPPSGDETSDGVIMRFHYGTPPPKQPDRSGDRDNARGI